MKILEIIFSTIVAFLAGVGISVYQSPCESPIPYAIGSVDRKFNLSTKELRANIDQAADIWATGYGKDMFVYDPTAKLKINMVFDERQGLSDQIGSMENIIKDQQTQIKPEIVKYQADLANFQQSVANLNSQISDWNAKGGAPKEEYDKLISAQKELQQQSEELNARAKRLNQSASQFNSQVGSLNQTINVFNSTLAGKPEEGLFDPNLNKIDIFFNVDRNELIHTLAHEMGHAWGMRHTSNPMSVMYFRSNRETVLTPEDKNELALVCKELPVWEIWQKNASSLIRENLRNWNLQAGKGS
jgi:hypothetical protein